MTSEPSTAIVVVAPNWLGDAVMSLPAIADIRRHFAAARLVVAARAAVADLFRLVPGVDDILLLQRSIRADAVRLAEGGADVAILLPNSFAAALLVRRASIAERWGYATDWRSPLLTRAIRRPRHAVHQAAYYQHLTSALGIPSGPLQPALNVPPRAIDAARRQLIASGWDEVSPIAVLAPGAAYGTAKRWIPAHVAALASQLTRERGVTCVLAGSRADRPTTSAVRGQMSADARVRAIDLTGETTLERLAGIFALAQVCVSNDSGAMHVAAAIGTPVVAVFGPTREYETAPLPRAGGRIDVLTHPVWCRPCMLRECPIDHRCMTRITPERVFLAADKLMAGATG